MIGRASTFYLGGVGHRVYFFTHFYFVLFFSPFLLDALHDTQDISSLTRDGTPAPCRGSTVLTTEPPGKSHPQL